MRNRAFQEELTGFHGPEVTPQGLKGRAPVSLRDEDQGLGPATKRGQVGEQQMMLNFDKPHEPLYTDAGGIVPIGTRSDPDWDRGAWDVGGFHKVEGSETNPDPYDVAVTEGWRKAPVTELGPDAEVRSGQVEPRDDGPGRQVAHVPEHVDMLRQEGEQSLVDPDSGQRDLPWIANVGGKRYALEGHHRLIAGRQRGEGTVPVHELKGSNWGQIRQQVRGGSR